MQDLTIFQGDTDTPGIALSSADSLVIREWLRSKRSRHTQRAYTRDIAGFLAFIGYQPLAQVTLTNIQDYAQALTAQRLEPSTQARKLATVKSLLTFAHKTGAIPFNVGAAQQLPQGKDKLAQRILSQAQVQNMIYEARGNPRNHTLLLLLYGSGIRCEEVCNLQWCDVQATSQGGQITVIGKRRKTRSIPLHLKVWEALQALRPASAGENEYVFTSRQQTIRGGQPSRRLTEVQAWRIVKHYAQLAGIPNASTHWLRHAHATHAMEKHAPLKLIQETLGHADLRTPSRYQHVRPESSTSLFLDL